MTTTPTTTQHGQPGFELRHRRRWIWILPTLAVIAGAAVLIRFTMFADTRSANEIPGATLVVATNEGNAAEQALIEYVAAEVAPRHGIKVAFRGLSDSNTINRAVSDGEVAGTIYQHKLWLAQVLQANPDFHEQAATPVFRWGFGIWSSRYSDPAQLPQGATVSLYSDPANEAQGLWLLERAGLITLDPSVDKWSATQRDIVANPKNLRFTLLDFAAQSRSLPDLDAAVGYTEYYLAANVPLRQQIFAPPPPDEFAGQLTVGSRWADADNIKRLVAAFRDPDVQRFLASDPAVKNVLLPLQPTR
ncbi:MetQ/NlpA family ABC transporter substrate-binding protein [Mycolicibacterium palauense]|uniref:MetQ/NlpA family ABC transporter substrate-binding protein n=1 Tax=Mycolicibacterium palauense TaxID=2034511 RepID=UPI000BFF0F93|nr:MetQ/NlpA family ABC transporter substrate-binding protein [Mycolicibacterium palauense]